MSEVTACTQSAERSPSSAILVRLILAMFALQSILINAASADPRGLSVAEIKKLGGRLGELSPTHTTFTPADNASFVDAMRLWNAHKWSEAVVKFQSYLSRFPNSPLAAEAELHLGCCFPYTLLVVEIGVAGIELSKSW